MNHFVLRRFVFSVYFLDIMPPAYLDVVGRKVFVEPTVQFTVFTVYHSVIVAIHY